MIDPIAVFVLLLGAATPILFAALGELVVERAGVLNLGVEGMMIGGALAGFAAAHATGSPAIGFAVAAVAGVLRILHRRHEELQRRVVVGQALVDLHDVLRA